MPEETPPPSQLLFGVSRPSNARTWIYKMSWQVLMCCHWRSHRLFSEPLFSIVLDFVLPPPISVSFSLYDKQWRKRSDHQRLQLSWYHCTPYGQSNSCPVASAGNTLKLERIMSWVCYINLERPPHATITSLHVNSIHVPCKRTIVQTDHCYIILCGLLFSTSLNISMSFPPAEIEPCKANQKAWHPASPHKIVQNKASNSKKLGEYYPDT